MLANTEHRTDPGVVSPPQPSPDRPSAPHVVQRLKEKTRLAWQLGFKIRFEVLDGQEANWCVVGGNKFIFVDLAIPAGEQLEQIERAIADYQSTQQRSSTAERSAA